MGTVCDGESSGFVIAKSSLSVPLNSWDTMFFVLRTGGLAKHARNPLTHVFNALATLLGIRTACHTSRTSLSKSLSLDSIDSLSLETVPSSHLTGLSSFKLSSPPSGSQLDSKEVTARSDFVSSTTMFVWEVHKSFD